MQALIDRFSKFVSAHSLALAIGFVGLFAYVNMHVWGDGGGYIYLLGVPIYAYSLIWGWVGLIKKLGAFIGAHSLAVASGFVGLFAYVNLHVWGDGGDYIHLLGVPVYAYSLIWGWIGLIAFISGINYVFCENQRHSIWFVISAWWAANIGMTSILNAIKDRGVEESGGTILLDVFGLSSVEMPVLMLDFIGQGSVDIACALLIWGLVSRRILATPVWLLIFIGFLIANIVGHLAGTWNLMAGVDGEVVAQSYEPYMYLAFTVMLVLQAIGAGVDAGFRWVRYDVDIYRDLRPIIERINNDYLHLP